MGLFSGYWRRLLAFFLVSSLPFAHGQRRAFVTYLSENVGSGINTIRDQQFADETAEGGFLISNIPEQPPVGTAQMTFSVEITASTIRVELTTPPSSNPEIFTERMFIWIEGEPFGDDVELTTLSNGQASFQVLPVNSEIFFFDPSAPIFEISLVLESGALQLNFVDAGLATVDLVPTLLEFSYGNAGPQPTTPQPTPAPPPNPNPPPPPQPPPAPPPAFILDPVPGWTWDFQCQGFHWVSLLGWRWDFQ